jgi:hypothetical protein
MVASVRRDRLGIAHLSGPLRCSRHRFRTSGGVAVAEKLDATARLAEGRPAVDNVQNYVWACHLLGYECPDLTSHASQVRDWYGSEDGLDLAVLSADCAAFERVVAATEQALGRQDDQLVAMTGAWSGYGADASREFLRRHGEASASAAAAVRTAADALASLRDRLWQAVDGKVATALAVDDRVAQRAEWLAAAQTVTTGAGDRAAASELVDQQVKPFVDNDIRADWLTAMRTASAAVTDSYEAATAELTAESAAVFEVPGDLGPSWTPPPRSDDVSPTPAAVASSPAPVASVPASWSPPPAATPLTAPPAMASPPSLPPPLAAQLEPQAPAMAPMGSMPPMGGGGTPDIGSGLSGFGQQLADTLSGLVGSADGALDDAELGEQTDELDELDEPEEPDDLDEQDEPTEPDDVEPAADTAEVCEQPPIEPPLVEPEPPPPPEPAPTPAPLPPPPEPLPSPEPLSATETPCEIAADELPQVGE